MTPRRADTRAVTVPTDYVLLIGITALLASGLLVGTGGFVADQQERAVRSGLEVVGNGLADDLTTADRLADSLGDDGRVTIETELPEAVAGKTYLVSIEQRAVTGDAHFYDLVLTSTAPDVVVRVPVRTHTAVDAETLDGGPVALSVTSDGDLEVRDV